MNDVIAKLIEMTKEDLLLWTYTDDGYEATFQNTVILIDYGDLVIGSVRFNGSYYPLIKTLENEVYKNVDRALAKIIKLKTVDDVIETVMGW